MLRSLPLACFAPCVIGLLGRLILKLQSQMLIFNRWSMRFAWLWRHVFRKVYVDHGCSSFRQNVKLFLTWMIWSRAKYQPWNCGNSMKRFHCVRIGTQKGAPCKLYMLWKVFLRLLQVPVKQTLVLHHHLLLLWLACLHVREGSRFHLCLCGRPVLVWRQKVPCLKNPSKCSRMDFSLRLKLLLCNLRLWIWWMVSCLAFMHLLRMILCLRVSLPFVILHVRQLQPLQDQKLWMDHLPVLIRFTKGLLPNLRPRPLARRNLGPKWILWRSVLLPRSQQIWIFQRERFRCISDACSSRWVALGAGIQRDAVQAVGLDVVTKHWVFESKHSLQNTTQHKKRKSVQAWFDVGVLIWLSSAKEIVTLNFVCIYAIYFGDVIFFCTRLSRTWTQYIPLSG